ncbi:hypothetical protein R3P38DRAFT_2756684 [Favolaschia claudopus]|uniref:Uncharacterized protein n=1 Tax=Favolaschia claudopus TaxID=2862362 RepID=A0AAW0EGY6_9AGAR
MFHRPDELFLLLLLLPATNLEEVYGGGGWYCEQNTYCSEWVSCKGRNEGAESTGTASEGALDVTQLKPEKIRAVWQRMVGEWYNERVLVRDMIAVMSSVVGTMSVLCRWRAAIQKIMRSAASAEAYRIVTHDASE